MFKLKLGSRGELVIPKKIRDNLGLTRNREVILDIKEKTLVIKQVHTDIVAKWEERAKKYRDNVSKWVYGDRLYEEVF